MESTHDQLSKISSPNNGDIMPPGGNEHSLGSQEANLTAERGQLVETCPAGQPWRGKAPLPCLEGPAATRPPVWKESRADQSPGKCISGVPQSQRNGKGPSGCHRNIGCPETLPTQPTLGDMGGISPEQHLSISVSTIEMNLPPRIQAQVQAHTVRAESKEQLWS